MCLIVFSHDRHPDYRLILGANRDEFYERPTTPARFWGDAPHVLAGRDDQAGGTWMGVTRSGRWAAITNVRDPGSRDPDAPSRGTLVSDYLTTEPDAAAYARDVAARAGDYNGFNLLVGSPEEVWYVSNYLPGDGEPVRPVEPGLHGLSNRLLDTPWPKVEYAKDGLDALDVRAGDAVEAGGHAADESAAEPAGAEEPQPGDLRQPEEADDPVTAILDLLDYREPFPDDRLPDTGVGLEKERMLSPPFIESDVYGTRSSTVLLVRRDGHVTFAERTFNQGDEGATRRFTFQSRPS